MIKLPNISEESCPTDDSIARCAEQPLEDELVIEPARISVCDNAAQVQFRLFIRNASRDINILQAITFSSSDESVFTVNSSSGLITVVAAGRATLTATWGGMVAAAEVIVRSGSSCCDSIGVGTVVLLDRSVSMLDFFNSRYGQKLTVARKITRDFAGLLNTTKDQMGLISFANTPRAMVGLTNDVDLLRQGVDMTFGYRPVYDIEDNTDIAGAIELALAALDACVPLPISETPDDEDETTPTQHNFHGSGPPAVDLGVPGDIYIDDNTNGVYWKSLTGWNP